MIKKPPPSEATRPASWPDAVRRFGAYLVEQEKSPNTVRCYGQDLAIFATWYEAEYHDKPELQTVAAAELRSWKAAMLDHKNAPQSVNRRLAALQSLLRWAEARDWCKPVQRPRTVRQERPRPRWLARKEQNALVRAVRAGERPRDVALVMLLIHAGLRISEAASLTWRAIEVSERKGSVTVIGKGRKQRTVPLNVDVRNALEELAAGYRFGTDLPVFEGREGKLTANALWRIVTRYARKAPLEDLTPHVLRHTFCRRLREAGVRLEEIAALAGHESIETTRQYVEPGEDDLRRRRASGGR